MAAAEAGAGAKNGDGDRLKCRDECGACCVAPAIKQSFYGMPQGKPAGVACVHLDRHFRCGLFDDARRPDVCRQFTPEPDFCGQNRNEALTIMLTLEGVIATDGQASAE